MNTTTKTRPAGAPAKPAAQTGEVVQMQHRSLIQKFASKYSIDADKLMSILKATAFKVSQGEVSNEQMAALLVVADQYGLNPFTKEIFAFEDKHKGIVPVVSVDGWARIINEREELNGIEFAYPDEEITAPDGGRTAFAWIECIIHRKDRDNPTKVREHFDEVYQKPRGDKGYHGPWQSHPKRMHRHKALIQCARIAFGFAGIYDEDEAHRIIEAEVLPAEPAKTVERGATGLKKAVVQTNAAGQEPKDSTSAGTQPQPAPAAQKQPGDAATRDKYIAKFAECKDSEILALVMDETREMEWTPEEREALDVAYSKRQDELGK